MNDASYFETACRLVEAVTTLRFVYNGTVTLDGAHVGVTLCNDTDADADAVVGVLESRGWKLRYGFKLDPAARSVRLCFDHEDLERRTGVGYVVLRHEDSKWYRDYENPVTCHPRYFRNRK